MVLPQETVLLAARRAAIRSMSATEFAELDSSRFEAEIVSMRKRKLDKARRYIGRKNAWLQDRCGFPAFVEGSKEWECKSPYCVFCHARWVFALSNTLFCTHGVHASSGEAGIDGTLLRDIAQYRFDHDSRTNFYIRNVSDLVFVVLNVILRQKASVEMAIDDKYRNVASVFRFIAFKSGTEDGASRSPCVLELCRTAFVPGGFTGLDEAADTLGAALRFPPTFWQTDWFWTDTEELMREVVKQKARFSSLRGCFRQPAKRVLSDKEDNHEAEN